MSKQVVITAIFKDSIGITRIVPDSADSIMEALQADNDYMATIQEYEEELIFFMDDEISYLTCHHGKLSLHLERV